MIPGMLHPRAAILPGFAFVILAAVAAVAGADESDPDEQAVKHHFADGKARYESGDYRGALEQFRQAKVIRDLPALDYNIARCDERLELWQDAIDGYERYLRGAPNAEDAPAARERVRVLRERLAALRGATPPPGEKAPGAGPASSSSPGVQPGSTRWLVPILVGAGALALLGAGVGLYASASSDLDGLRATCGRDASCGQDQVDSVDVRARAAYALFAIGGAVAAADVALFVIKARAQSGRRGAWLAPAGPGVVLRGSF
jgi:tetratricopeptide (TPR) repeat protein